MNTLKFKSFLVALLFALMLTSGSVTQAASIEGIVQGYGCMVIQKLCAVDQNDPRAAAEKNFVIVDKDGTYYYITNIDSSLFSGKILNQARVTGIVDSKYNTVAADKLEFFSRGKWHEAWSMEKEKERRETFSSTAG